MIKGKWEAVGLHCHLPFCSGGLCFVFQEGGEREMVSSEPGEGEEGSCGPGSLTLPLASQALRSLGFKVGSPVSFGQTPPCLLKE